MGNTVCVSRDTKECGKAMYGTALSIVQRLGFFRSAATQAAEELFRLKGTGFRVCVRSAFRFCIRARL